MDFDVFISYAHEDRDFARNLKSRLEAENLGDEHIRVWMDDRIEIGAFIWNKINKYLENVAIVVLIVSPDSMNSESVTYEWSRAIFELDKDLYPIHSRRCRKEDPGMFKYLWNSGVKIPEPLDSQSKEDQLGPIIENIKTRLTQLPEIRRAGKVLIEPNISTEHRRRAVQQLLQFQSLRSVVVDCLLRAIDYQMAGYGNGEVQVEIANAIYQIGDRRCVNRLVQLFAKGGGYEPAGNAIISALMNMKKRNK